MHACTQLNANISVPREDCLLMNLLHRGITAYFQVLLKQIKSAFSMIGLVSKTMISFPVLSYGDIFKCINESKIHLRSINRKIKCENIFFVRIIGYNKHTQTHINLISCRSKNNNKSTFTRVFSWLWSMDDDDGWNAFAIPWTVFVIWWIVNQKQ